MAHGTLVSAGGKVVIQRPKGVSFGLGYTNGTDILPGSLVTGDGMTSPDLNLVDAAGEEIAGVAVRMVGTAAATAPDTAFADNEPFEYAPRGSGMVVYVRFTSNDGWNPGEWVVGAGNGTGEGAWDDAVADNLSTVLGAFRDLIGTGVNFEADTSDGSGDYTYIYQQVRLSI